jgi:dCMP deaminase
MSDWDYRFLQLAQVVGSWSKDRSRKVGCVIVDDERGIKALGYNGFPRGIEDTFEARHSRPAKYLWTEHAERNAIYHAARMGIRLEGCTMYLPWFPCMDCARAIVQAGIKRLVAFRPDTSDPQWGEQFVAALELIREVGVTLELIEPSDLTSLQPSGSEP